MEQHNFISGHHHFLTTGKMKDKSIGGKSRSKARARLLPIEE